jgi:glutamate N-acetyltransferase/amino-acid N-acetyltransferase
MPEKTQKLIALRGGLGALAGIKLTGLHAGIKPRKPDLALIVFNEPQIAASAITINEIKAAPLLVSEEHLAASGERMRVVICNAGCANACTGERGMRDARETARQAAALLGVDPTQVVLASTGVIGVPLPMDRMSKGLEHAIQDLREGAEGAAAAAQAILTTDKKPKLSAYAFQSGNTQYEVGGIAKGSGMIAPNMATMLAFVATNAPMSRQALHHELRQAVSASFNMISVDGDMSTNDAVYAFAHPGRGDAPPGFREALRAVTHDLALAIVADGEGATKILTMLVDGAREEEQARVVAHAIVNSNLVKTALHGEDPNWGRIIAAAGAAGVGIDPHTWSIFINETLWVDKGGVEMLSEAQAHHELKNTSVHIRLHLGMGEAQALAWGCDLSREYVRINASYRT